MHIHDMHKGGHFEDQDQGTNATQGFLEFGWEDDQIVTTDGRQFEDVGVLVLVVIVLFVVGHQLARVPVTCYKVRNCELDQSVGMVVVLVMEVEAIMHLSDVDGLLMGIMSQNHLLQEQECALVVDALS
jgi:hypothetical protein